MLDLLSIKEINPIKEEIRCRKCLKFNTIIHASDLWDLVDDKYVRLEVPSVDSCFLIDSICNGHAIREEEYARIDACDGYEFCDEWKGINKTFITVIDGIIIYLSLSDSGDFDRAAILEVAKKISQKTVAIMDVEEEKNNKDLRLQFRMESMNYNVMEGVRRLLNDA